MNTYYIIVLYIKKEPLRNYSEQDLYFYIVQIVYCCISTYLSVILTVNIQR